jgi:hypothetical protein
VIALDERWKPRHKGGTTKGGWLLFVFFVGCVGVYALGQFGSGLSTSPQPRATRWLPTRVPTPKTALVLQEGWDFERGQYGVLFIVGTVKNQSSKEYSYVQISLSLYDTDGAVIGTAFDNVGGIDPYGTWKFKALCLEDVVKTARFKDLTGW